MAFGLIIGFVKLLQYVTTNNCSGNCNSHTLQFSTSCTKSSQSAVSSPVVTGNGFQCHNFLSFRVHVITGWRLPHISLIGPAETLRLVAISQQPPTLLTAISKPSHSRSCSSLYSLGMDRIENTSPISSSVVASCSYRTDCVENTVCYESVA
jgi:hypothetical protein